MAHPTEAAIIEVPWRAWELTQPVFDASAGVEEWLRKKAMAKRSQENHQRGKDQAEMQNAREGTIAEYTTELAMELAKKVRAKQGRMTHTELRGDLSVKKRKALEEAIKMNLIKVATGGRVYLKR